MVHKPIDGELFHSLFLANIELEEKKTLKKS